MFRKSNLRTLIVVFVVLLGIVVAINLFKKEGGTRTFRKEILIADTALIDKIVLKPRVQNHEEVVLNRNASGWKLESNGNVFSIDEQTVNSMLGELAHMVPQRVAATKEESWKKYEVTDSLSTQVMVYSAGKLLAHLYVGKFSYQQPDNPYQRQGTMFSYVRLHNEPEVYSVNGFLNMIFNKKSEQIRNKTLIKGNSRDWTRLTYSYPGDSSFVLTRQDTKWFMNGIPADSTTVYNYLTSIENLSGNEPVNQDLPSGSDYFSLRIEGNNVNPLEVTAAATDSVSGYFISGSQNKGAVFKAQGLMQKIFVSPQKFISIPADQ